MIKTTVVSAINIVDGGALTVLQDAMKAFDSNTDTEHSVIFLVSNPSVHSGIELKHIKFIYFPLSKKSWFLRFFYEYVYFYLLSLKIKPHTWFSLHDTTPSVKASQRYVYCHNPSIFLKMPLSSALMDPKQFAFSKFYKYLYKINIKKNTSVITQQAWMADEFCKRFDISNVIVAAPDVDIRTKSTQKTDTSTNSDTFKLFYPAYPRYFKNHEIIFKTQHLVKNTSFWLTLSGRENNYTRKLIQQYPLTNISLLGLLQKAEVEERYETCDALIFPSLLETWGLPLTEFKEFNKPIIAADLEYAHETIGNYSKIYWFDPESAESLALAIHRARHKETPDDSKPKVCKHMKILGWDSLATHIIGR